MDFIVCTTICTVDRAVAECGTHQYTPSPSSLHPPYVDALLQQKLIPSSAISRRQHPELNPNMNYVPPQKTVQSARMPGSVHIQRIFNGNTPARPVTKARSRARIDEKPPFQRIPCTFAFASHGQAGQAVKLTRSGRAAVACRLVYLSLMPHVMNTDDEQVAVLWRPSSEITVHLRRHHHRAVACSTNRGSHHESSSVMAIIFSPNRCHIVQEFPKCAHRCVGYLRILPDVYMLLVCQSAWNRNTLCLKAFWGGSKSHRCGRVSSGSTSYSLCTEWSLRGLPSAALAGKAISAVIFPQRN